MTNTNEELSDKMQNALELIGLSEEERVYLDTHPSALPSMWVDTSRSIALRYFPAIMLSQVEKAMKGDTASAKFLTEFIEPNDETNEKNQQPVEWEALAIALRDRLQLELSAENLVKLLLLAAATMTNEDILSMLGDLPASVSTN